MKKVSGGVTTTYYVQDGVCYGESRSDGKSLQYLRDENGQVIGVRYQNGNIWDTTYYFVFNGQGDVIQVVSAEDGQVMANYTYDAWGKLLSVTNAAGGAISDDAESIGAVNPFRYRGYYYDTETGLYYLQSRYYDADVGRFVNADESVYSSSLLGANLFAYCGNNAIRYADPTGEWFGVDDVATGPIDEIIVLGGLAILSLFGVSWAQDAQLQIQEGFQTMCAEIGILFSKPSKGSDKERSTDKPSWVNKDMVDSSLSAEENARRILDNKWGKGNWGKGPNSEFNKIKKWLTRSLGLSQLVPGDDNDDNVLIYEGDVYIFDPSGKGFGWVNGVYWQRVD